MKAVILAGGGGSRLWPLSNKETPKQFLKIYGNHTLLQNTVLRLAGMIAPENILIVTNQVYREETCEQLAAIDTSADILCEPCARNTAPAVACAIEFLSRQKQDEVVLVLPADHLIQDVKNFHISIVRAVELAENGAIVTLGIKPEYPETGFGYIKRAEACGSGFRVEKFVEKPSLEVAGKYLADGSYFWNGGIFIGKISTFLAEFEDLCPEIFSLARECEFSGNIIDPEIFPAMPKISIDYAVMEKSSRIMLTGLLSDWSDLGSWQAVYRIGRKDADGNVIIGRAVVHNVRNSLIFSVDGVETAASDMEGVVIVNTGKTTMICPLKDSQNVRFLQEEAAKTRLKF